MGLQTWKNTKKYGIVGASVFKLKFGMYSFNTLTRIFITTYSHHTRGVQ